MHISLDDWNIQDSKIYHHLFSLKKKNIFWWKMFSMKNSNLFSVYVFSKLLLIDIFISYSYLYFLKEKSSELGFLHDILGKGDTHLNLVNPMWHNFGVYTQRRRDRMEISKNLLAMKGLTRTFSKYLVPGCRKCSSGFCGKQSAPCVREVWSRGDEMFFLSHSLFCLSL